MSGPRHPLAGRDAVADYLAAVAARLTGPAAARVAITDELRDGLLETLERHLARGRSHREAMAAAIEEFGDPPTVAAAFAPELAAVQARRVALGLMVTGPLAAVVADLTLLTNVTGQALTGPGWPAWAPALLAVGASLTRVTLAGRTLRRCLAARAAVT